MIIDAKGIEKSFGSLKVLKGVDFQVDRAEVVAIMGASGAGKSTLLQILGTLSTPDAGTLRVDGTDVLHLGSRELSAFRNRRIGFVFQEDRLCEEFSAVSNVRLGAGKDMSREEIVRRLTEIGLGDSLKKPVKEFSGGMKRRVAIVRAVCCPAELLILDEPFKGLDEKLRLEVIGFIRRYTQGRTVICVTHEPEDAERLGGGIVEMEKAGA